MISGLLSFHFFNVTFTKAMAGHIMSPILYCLPLFLCGRSAFKNFIYAKSIIKELHLMDCGEQVKVRYLGGSYELVAIEDIRSGDYVDFYDS